MPENQATPPNPGGGYGDGHPRGQGQGQGDGHGRRDGGGDRPARPHPQRPEGREREGGGGEGRSPVDPPAREADARGKDADPEQRRDAGPDGDAQERRSVRSQARDSINDREVAEEAGLYGARLRAAQINFNVAGGSLVFGGSQEVVGGVGGAHGAFRALGVIGWNEVDRLLTSFVRPACYKRLLACLRSHQVVVLRARWGWGRTATAQYLLSEVLRSGPTGSADDPDDNPDNPGSLGNSGNEHGANREATTTSWSISRLPADTDLRDVKASKLTEHSGLRRPGYLLDVGLLAGSDAIRASDLHQLSEDFRQHSSYLVVTVDAEVRFGDDLGEFLVDGDEPPDPVEVLAAHIARLEGTSRKAALRRLRDDEEVAGLVREIMTEGISVESMALLAEQLVRAGGDARSKEVRDWVQAYARDRFVQWVSAPREVEQHAFMIALAVFNRMSFVKVARVARDLETKMRSARWSERRPLKPIFAGSRYSRLQGIRATLRQETEQTVYGPVPVENVQFRNKNEPTRILSWLWHEQDNLHEVLYAWLTALGSDPDPAVRVRAAAAVGLFATWDFDEIRLRILLPWADTRRAWQQECAATALSVTMRSRPELEPVITAMLRDWKFHTAHTGRRWTAVRAWGASLGEQKPALAMERLAELAKPIEEDDEDLDLDFPLIVAVARSVLELFIGTGEDAAAHVLWGLGMWTHPGQLDPIRQTGVLCYLHIATLVGDDQDGRYLRWSADSPPKLLVASRDDPETLKRVAVLWRRSLSEGELSDVALEALLRWVEHAEREESLHRTFIRILEKQSGQRAPRETRLLFNAFNRIVNEHPRTAGDALDILGREHADERG